MRPAYPLSSDDGCSDSAAGARNGPEGNRYYSERGLGGKVSALLTTSF